MSKRRPFVAGNWKMNTDRASGVALALDVARGVAGVTGSVDVGVCPPFVYVNAVARALRGVGSSVMIGAQDVYHEASGAFTGEVSCAMLTDVGATIAIVGHSERRHVLGETDAQINKKVRAALTAGLQCILCVGETLEQRNAGETDRVNESQLRAGLAGVTAEQLGRLTIAYEPVWAIGTGKTATPGDAQAAHAAARKVLGSLFGGPAAQEIRIQYGGSVKADNAKELFAQPDIDGGLIGGAALNADSFVKIVLAAG